jgi:hypothetical protein
MSVRRGEEKSGYVLEERWRQERDQLRGQVQFTQEVHQVAGALLWSNGKFFPGTMLIIFSGRCDPHGTFPSKPALVSTPWPKLSVQFSATMSWYQYL